MTFMGRCYRASRIERKGGIPAAWTRPSSPRRDFIAALGAEGLGPSYARSRYPAAQLHGVCGRRCKIDDRRSVGIAGVGVAAARHFVVRSNELRRRAGLIKVSRRRAAEPGDEIAPSKKDAHLGLPCEPVDQAGGRGSTGDRRTGGGDRGLEGWRRGPYRARRRAPRGADSGSFNREGVIVEHRFGSSDPCTPNRYDPPGFSPRAGFRLAREPTEPRPRRRPRAGPREPAGAFCAEVAYLPSPASTCLPHVSRRPPAQQSESRSQRHTATSFIFWEAIPVTF
jgi:hypothetical protein